MLCVCHLEPSSILICVTLQLESQAGALSLPGFTCDRRLTSPSPPHLINTLFQIGPKQAFSIFLQQFHGMTISAQIQGFPLSLQNSSIMTQLLMVMVKRIAIIALPLF